MNKKLILTIIFVLIVSAVVLLVVANVRKPVSVSNVSDTVSLSPIHKVIGRSVEGRPIEAYTYTAGERNDGGAMGAAHTPQNHIVFVGGIHGGYEWNSVLLAYQFMDFLALPENANFIPAGLTTSVIPSANPDAVFRVVGKEGRFALADVPFGDQFDELKASARFNANGVDLNRNFDCKWQPESTWRSEKVSAGTAPFSEPEAIAIRDFILLEKPSAVIFWHSQANAVYASECENGILSSTLDIMNAYAQASGYSPIKNFDSYSITGDAEGWLASIGTPAITVELSTHESTEWTKNLAGIKAVMDYLKR